MARKPANTKTTGKSDSESATNPVAPETASSIADAAGTSDTPIITGTAPEVAASDAPNTPGANDQGQGDGGAGDINLPAITGEPEELPDADYMVVCHLKDGRRRAGRRWSSGETPVRADELTDYQLAQLRGDPQFTVFSIEKD